MRSLLGRDRVRAVLDERARRLVGMPADALVSTPPDDLPHVAAIPHLFALAGEYAVTTAGRTTFARSPSPEGALDAHLDLLQRALGCLDARASWWAGPRVVGADEPFVVSTDTDPLVVTRPGRVPLRLSFTEHIRLTEREQGWAVVCVGYFWTVSADEVHAEPLAVYHWHPTREAAPHLHAKLAEGEQRIPARFPTGWVSLPSVVRFAVEHLGAPPQHPGWSAELDDVEIALWGDAPWQPTRVEGP